LINYYKWSIEDIENMMFWEREIYINLLAEEKEKESQLKMSQQFGR
jgi:hypothetical protein